MYKLTVTLQQHTPLIHFQHEQEGAVLRATEVKPKLDRFIISRLGDGNYQKGLEIAKGEKKWVINEFSLGYKMRFIINESPEISIINEIKEKNGERKKKTRVEDGKEIYDLKTYPLYFGNLDKDIENSNEYKKFSFLYQPFFMQLFSFNKEIIKWVEENGQIIADFFASHNFGSRQTKGFGSYYIHKENKKFYKPIESKFKFSLNIQKNEWKSLFSTIDNFYKSLRSGINLKNKEGRTEFYFKSLLFLYFRNQTIQWDKKSIKDFFFSNDIEKQKKVHENVDTLAFSSEKKLLIKDLLGLSTNENWISYERRITKENREKEIDRFKSPIIFKPIQRDNRNYDIFLFMEKVNLDFLNKTFDIKSSKQNSTLSLTTPAKFDVEDFLLYILNKSNFDIDTHVKNQFHNHKLFKELKRTFEELRDNLKE